jgi:hypothetical protein
MPIPRGKLVRTTTYQDANLMHDLVTGRSMTGILHVLNQTPIQWFSKKQNVVETATYGSEFMAARQAVEQIMDLRYTLRMMGIPIDGPSWMFGDNQSVLTSSTIPHSSLNKRHNALSYHRVREAIAAGVINFMHVEGKCNPSDVMTKFLGWNKFWPLIQPLLFWKGETMREFEPTTPIPEMVKAMNTRSPSVLRGVSNGMHEQKYMQTNLSHSVYFSPSGDRQSVWQTDDDFTPNLGGVIAHSYESSDALKSAHLTCDALTSAHQTCDALKSAHQTSDALKSAHQICDALTSAHQISDTLTDASEIF